MEAEGCSDLFLSMVSNKMYLETTGHSLIKQTQQVNFLWEDTKPKDLWEHWEMISDYFVLVWVKAHFSLSKICAVPDWKFNRVWGSTEEPENCFKSESSIIKRK